MGGGLLRVSVEVVLYAEWSLAQPVVFGWLVGQAAAPSSPAPARAASQGTR